MITLNKPINIVVNERRSVTEVSVDHYIDLPDNKKIIVFLHQFSNPIELWVGMEYDIIGDWTEKQAEERLVEVLGLF
jgi:hypothetical protein